MPLRFGFLGIQRYPCSTHAYASGWMLSPPLNAKAVKRLMHPFWEFSPARSTTLLDQIAINIFPEPIISVQVVGSLKVPRLYIRLQNSCASRKCPRRRSFMQIIPPNRRNKRKQNKAPWLTPGGPHKVHAGLALRHKGPRLVCFLSYFGLTILGRWRLQK